MKINISNIADQNELLSFLRDIDISVPLRTDGRTTPHVETWSICRLLSTLAEASLLNYPLSLEHRDRPDFFLQCDSMKIGIEATEAISEQYAAYQALAEREFPDVLLEPGLFRWGAKKRTNEQMRELLREGRLSSAPWEGDKPEREWALYIESVIDAKLQKLTKPGFGLFAENWLAIYDNLSLPNIDFEKALNFLRPKLEKFWIVTPRFTSVFIEHGLTIARLDSPTISIMKLKNLWGLHETHRQ